jgi:heme/copper-type cytochrome/quinol oxidase subunit 3
MVEPISTASGVKCPKGPNFLLIFIVFAVTLFAILFGAWFLLSETGKKLLPGRHTAHPTSHVLPTPSDTTAA